MSEDKNLQRNFAIKAAFRKLNPRKVKAPNLRRAIETTCMVCESSQKSTPPSFRDAGQNKTARELKKIISLSGKLAQHLDSLHGPTILALADIGFHEIRITLPPVLNKIASAIQEKILAKNNLAEPTSGNSTAAAKTRTSNQGLIRKNATSTKGEKFTKGGRPINQQANALAKMLSHYYQDLTEKEPTLKVDSYSKNSAASGAFLELVKSVFKAAGIRSNPEHAARLAIEARRLKRRKPDQH